MCPSHRFISRSGKFTLDYYANSGKIVFSGGVILKSQTEEIRSYGTFHDALLDLIRDEASAQKTICIEAPRIPFHEDLFSLGKLLRLKAEAGVDVRLILGKGAIFYTAEIRRLKKSGVRVKKGSSPSHTGGLKLLATFDGSKAYVGMKSFKRFDGVAASRLEESFDEHWKDGTGILPDDFDDLL